MVIEYILPETFKQFQVLFIYLFLGGLSLAGISSIFLIHKNDDSMIGKGFLAFTVIKILGSFMFLLPWLMDQDGSTRPFVYQFFAVFFPTLLVETMVILRVITAIEDEKTKNDQNQDKK